MCDKNDTGIGERGDSEQIQALKMDNERLRLALETADVALYEWDVDSATLVWDERYLTMLDYAPGELPPHPETWVGLLHPDERESLIARMSDFGTGSTDREYAEYRMRAKSGEWRWILDKAKVMERYPDGRPRRITGAHLDITPSRLHEQEVTRFKEQFERVFSSLEEAVFVVDYTSDRILDCNDASIQIFGYDRDEMLSHKSEILHESADSYALIQGPVREVLKSGESYSGELEMRRKNGELFSAEIFVRFIYGKESPLRHVVGVVRDISARKRFEARLSQTEANLKAFFNTIDDFLFVLDMQGQILEVNDTVSRRLHYTQEDLRKQSATIIHPPNSRDAAQQIMDDMLCGKATHCPIPLMTKTGDLIPVETRIVRGLWNGRPALFGVSKDVTELQLSEEKFSKAFHASPAPMAISTLDEGVYVDVNESFTSSLGFARDEIIGRTPLELELYANPEDRKKFIAGLREFGIIRNYEIQVRTRNGKLRDGLFYADTIRLHGRACILSVMTDITEVKRTETERLKMEIQLRNTQKFESLGLLAGGIAHDFNNLLMAVLGNAEAALDILPEDDPARAYLNSIERAGQRAADLTRQMLAYSGRDHFEAKALDVSQLVTEMTGLMEIGLSKKAGLKLLLTENLPSVIADAGQIQQVIMNIVSNASEALDETGGLITVSTGYTRMEDEEINKAVFHEDAHSGLYVYIEVSDTGCGIAPDGIAQMFDPFYSTKCTGRGLGMAVVQGIVQGHKGIISVQSKTGQGATIRVSLPATSADPQRFMAANAPVPTQKWQGSGKILVVDDEEDIRSLAQMALERFGFSVLLANDGVHAIDLFREHRNEIALVLLDMTMPRMDGRETFLALRELRPDVPVVVASGYSEHDIARRFSDISFQGVLTKPYRRSQLLERVRKALAGRQLPRD